MFTVIIFFSAKVLMILVPQSARFLCEKTFSDFQFRILDYELIVNRQF